MSTAAGEPSDPADPTVPHQPLPPTQAFPAPPTRAFPAPPSPPVPAEPPPPTRAHPVTGAPAPLPPTPSSPGSAVVPYGVPGGSAPAPVQGWPAPPPGSGYPPPPHAVPHARQPYPPAPVVVVGRKEPALAGVLSWLLPGLGQFYAGRTGAGVGFLVSYLLNLPFVLLLGFLVVPILVSLAIVVWAVVDAVLGAQQRNRQLAARLAQHGLAPPAW